MNGKCRFGGHIEGKVHQRVLLTKKMIHGALIALLWEKGIRTQYDCQGAAL